MELIEIRNNLIKLSYGEDEKPTLGQFVALTSDEKSYVAQYVNLKADNINNFAVAKLLFTFSSDGIVSEFDGSVPSMKSDLVPLAIKELLDLLPIETPIQVGKIVSSDEILNIDVSLFEQNFTVFCENDYEKSTLISNFVRQLFRMKEKSVIIDTDSFFEDYHNSKLGIDFKLPLNSDFIDFIFEQELKDTDATTKAVIQDIFYAVQQYIKTLDDQFISIESFIDVVAAQYKETQMPELALLKNKLLKYRDAQIFADEVWEFKALEQLFKERNCIVINVKDVAPELQKELITYIHKLLEKFDKYVYFFVPLTDDNSDKKLLKRLINHSHVFTTVFASHLYKYASELKAHAQNILFFAPMTLQHDFAPYNTFLNKLNKTEGVIYGKLTQGIPLIIDLYDLDLDLTKEDVFGDRERFIPAIEEPEEEQQSDFDQTEELEQAQYNQVSQSEEDDNENLSNPSANYDEDVVNSEHEETEEESQDLQDAEIETEEQDIQTEPEEHIENILADDYDEKETSSVIENTNEAADEDSDDLDFMEEISSEENENSETVTDELTEDDLDFIENNQETLQNEGISEEDLSEEDEEDVPMVPVFSTEDENNSDETEYKEGDEVISQKYGKGIVEKIKKYGNKTLYSINFENVGRRYLDSSVSNFEKI